MNKNIKKIIKLSDLKNELKPYELDNQQLVKEVLDKSCDYADEISNIIFNAGLDVVSKKCMKYLKEERTKLENQEQSEQMYSNGKKEEDLESIEDMIEVYTQIFSNANYSMEYINDSINSIYEQFGVPEQLRKEHAFKKKQPVYCGQDLRDLEGYKISKVMSDDNDLDVRMELVNKKTGDIVTLEFDTLCFDGDTMYLR